MRYDLTVSSKLISGRVKSGKTREKTVYWRRNLERGETIGGPKVILHSVKWIEFCVSVFCIPVEFCFEFSLLWHSVILSWNRFLLLKASHLYVFVIVDRSAFAISGKIGIVWVVFDIWRKMVDFCGCPFSCSLKLSLSIFWESIWNVKAVIVYSMGL